MEENLNQNTSQSFTNENPYTSTTPPVSPTSTKAVSATGLLYAGFWERFIAALIDGVIVGVGSGIIQAIFGRAGESGLSLGSIIGMVLGYAYYVYFITKSGQTIGKRALGLRVQSESTGENLDIVSAILREVVGKILSSIVVLLGYFWMLWDPKKQTWHDKIARSVVVKVK